MDFWYNPPLPTADPERQEHFRQRVTARFGHVDPLGQLADIVARLAALHELAEPMLKRPGVAVFGADHGVYSERVSAQSREHTAAELSAIAGGSAPLNALLVDVGAELIVVDAGTAGLSAAAGAQDSRVAAGTGNICREPAMSAEQCQQALQVGAQAVDALGDIDIFIGGDVGVGSTTSAAAVAIAHTRLAASAMTGPGSGLDVAGIDKKAAAVTRALGRHLPKIREPECILAFLGGFEMVALAGAYLRAAQRGVPSLVDGYVAGAAAMTAVAMNPGLQDWLVFAHCSSEPGHKRLLSKLQAFPLLDLQLNCGSAVGAALALPVLQRACSLARSGGEA